MGVEGRADDAQADMVTEKDLMEKFSIWICMQPAENATEPGLGFWRLKAHT